MENNSFSKIEKYIHLGKADLHIHSNFSDGRPSIPEVLDYVQNETDLDVIAISDHDTIEGALLALDIVKKGEFHFEVIVGEEISCKEGHVIGLFLKKTIPAGLSAEVAIQRIRQQGGLVYIPHPLRHVRVNTGKHVLDGVDLITLVKEKKYIDAMESLNGTPTMDKDNIRASFFNDTIMIKAEMGGSDAHILEAIGMGYTLFEGNTALNLREAIVDCQTRAMHKKWKFLGLMQYLFFFLPQGLRLFISTLLHGRRPKRVQIVNLPKSSIKALGDEIKKKWYLSAQITKKRADKILMQSKLKITEKEFSEIEVKNE